MIKIIYPPYQPKIKTVEGKEFIFDEVRKQWLVLTPEEWVRQNFLQYLIHQQKYPSSLIAIEKEIYLGDVKKRFDIIVYDKNTKPWIIVECKEMAIELNEAVLSQALRYNSTIQAPYIIITNGTYCFAFVVKDGKFSEINEMPEYPF